MPDTPDAGADGPAPGRGPAGVHRSDGVREVARRAVQRLGGPDLELFDVVADDFFTRDTVTVGRTDRDGPLVGFGPDDVGTIATAALGVAAVAATGSIEAYGQMATHGVVRRFTDWRARRRRIRPDPDAVVPAMPDTTASIVQLVHTARRFGLSEVQAAELATAVLSEIDRKP